MPKIIWQNANTIWLLYIDITFPSAFHIVRAMSESVFMLLARSNNQETQELMSWTFPIPHWHIMHNFLYAFSNSILSVPHALLLFKAWKADNETYSSQLNQSNSIDLLFVFSLLIFEMKSCNLTLRNYIIRTFLWGYFPLPGRGHQTRIMHEYTQVVTGSDSPVTSSILLIQTFYRNSRVAVKFRET